MFYRYLTTIPGGCIDAPWPFESFGFYGILWCIQMGSRPMRPSHWKLRNWLSHSNRWQTFICGCLFLPRPLTLTHSHVCLCWRGCLMIHLNSVQFVSACEHPRPLLALSRQFCKSRAGAQPLRLSLLDPGICFAASVSILFLQLQQLTEKHNVALVFKSAFLPQISWKRPVNHQNPQGRWRGDGSFSPHLGLSMKTTASIGTRRSSATCTCYQG